MFPLRDANPSRRAPLVMYLIFSINVLAFGWEMNLGDQLGSFLQSSAFVPSKIVADGDLQVRGALVSMFLHGGWLHLGGNMLYLWVFADNIEDRLGHLKFAFFYVATGLTASYAHALVALDSSVPTIGASGAIAGVLGAYLVLHPAARITTVVWLGVFVTTLEVPAWIYLAFWFVFQLFSGLAVIGASPDQGGVAWWAHIGGFAAGVVWLAVLDRKAFRRRRA